MTRFACVILLDAARETVWFSRGRVREDLDSDRQLVPALVKDKEIVGEAAAQIGEHRQS